MPLWNGAWRLIARDGLESAGIVLHAVLDMFALEGIPLPASLQSDAFARLVPFPETAARDALAVHMALALPRPA
jgi:hypothetical protein